MIVHLAPVSPINEQFNVDVNCFIFLNYILCFVGGSSPCCRARHEIKQEGSNGKSDVAAAAVKTTLYRSREESSMASGITTFFLKKTIYRSFNITADKQHVSWQYAATLSFSPIDKLSID